MLPLRAPLEIPESGLPKLVWPLRALNLQFRMNFLMKTYLLEHSFKPWSLTFWSRSGARRASNLSCWISFLMQSCHFEHSLKSPNLTSRSFSGPSQPWNLTFRSRSGALRASNLSFWPNLLLQSCNFEPPRIPKIWPPETALVSLLFDATPTPWWRNRYTQFK